MRKLSLFSRLAAVLLTVMMTLPWQAFAEDIQLNLKVGEIYSGDLSERIFKGDNALPFLDGASDGNVYIFPKDLGLDEFSHRQYQIGNIYAQREGTSYIKIQPETVYDESGNATAWPTHTITVNVSGNYVTAAAASDDVSASSYEPDPAVLHDLTLAPGASAYNWMKLVYVWGCGFAYSHAPENFRREWMEVPEECVTITSSNSSIVEVSNGQFIARGTDGQSATITMSCAPSGEYLNVPTGSVSFTVNIDGSAAVEKEDIDMYFQDYDYSTYQDVRISEFEMIMDETGYYESHTIEFKWSLPGVPNVTFASSDDESLEVDAEADAIGNDRYLVSFYPHSYGHFTVTATFNGDAQYNEATAKLEVDVINSRYSFAKDLVFKEQSDPSSPYNPYDVIVDHLEMTEGETVKLPELCHRYEQYPASHTLFPSQSTARGHFVAPWADPSCHDVGCAVDVEHITAVAAGRDTLVVKYHFYSDEPLETVKLPIRILPLVQPVANNTETSFDFAYTTPGANSELIFQTTANDKVNDGKLEISTTLNPSQVETFIDRNAAGTQAWLDNLQGALTLNLPAGQGTLSIECYADPGVEFKLKIRGKAAVTIAQTSMGTAEVNFDLEEPTAVIIYLTGAGGYSPAPKRAPAAKAESAKGYIQSISIAPRADIAAKQDPDHAGVYYSTFFDSSRKFTLPAGTEAYVATISGEDMIMNKVVNGGEVLPANTPVILKSNVASLSLTPTDDAAVTISAENALHGVDEATAAPANCYVLSGHSTDNSVTGVGFYEFTGTIPAHKAYLTISGGAAYAPKKLRFVFNNEQQATGIDNAADGIMSEKRIENGQLVIIKNGVRYNAQGQVIQ
jgi:hypothetical protein